MTEKRHRNQITGDGPPGTALGSHQPAQPCDSTTVRDSGVFQSLRYLPPVQWESEKVRTRQDSFQWFLGLLGLSLAMWELRSGRFLTIRTPLTLPIFVPFHCDAPSVLCAPRTGGSVTRDSQDVSVTLAHLQESLFRSQTPERRHLLLLPCLLYKLPEHGRSRPGLSTMQSAENPQPPPQGVSLRLWV